MTKRQVSTWGKWLFLIGLLVFIIGSPFGWMVIWLNIRPLLLEQQLVTAGIGFALIILSFAFLAYGSRVGDNQN